MFPFQEMTAPVGARQLRSKKKEKILRLLTPLQQNPPPQYLEEKSEIAQ